MKLLAFGLIALGWIIASTPVEAAACHAGVYRSGCVSRYGAVVRQAWLSGLRQPLLLARWAARLLLRFRDDSGV